MTIIWPGTPGETYTNDTGKIVYQFKVSGFNTCGACWQYNGAIAKWWSKMHRGCNCVSIPIYPDAKSAPYEDWRELVDGLPEDQKERVVGTSNMKLIEQGVIDWSDVVTSNRVRLFREVVSIKGLTVEQMIDAGVRRDLAESAWFDVHTEEHDLVDQQRAALVAQIVALGIQPTHLQEIFGDVMAQKISLAGPSGTDVIPPGISDQEWVEILLRGYKP